MDEQLKAAVLAAKGAEDEAKAIAQYLEQFIAIKENPPEESVLKQIDNQYSEIISDELNHLVRFTRLVSELSGIEIKED